METTQQRCQVLLIEDNPGDARLVREMLVDACNFTFDIKWDDRLTSGLTDLTAPSVDIVLLDLSLPDSQGIETLRRAQSRAPSVPIVVLTGQDDQDLAIQAVHEGAQDYLVKSQADGPSLLHAIRYAVERKQAEEERVRLLHQIATERNWLRTVIEHCPVGMVLFRGADGRQLVTNPKAEDMFGCHFAWEEGEAIRVEVTRRSDGTPLSRIELASIRALNGDIVVGEEQRIRLPNGEVVPILVNASPIRDDEGNVQGAVVTFDDISAIKDLERLREEWISIVTHDLRQPLTIITGYADLIQKHPDPLPLSVTRANQHVLQSTKRLIRMIEDLLDASRLEADRLILRHQAIDPADFVSKVVERYQSVSPNRSIRFDVIGSVKSLVADPERLEQALGNLISNAVKYGYPDTEIRIALLQRGDELEVSVSNQGDGIDPEDLPGIFNRFHRAKSACQKKIEGMGLGLYITKGLIEAHGGQIRVVSTARETTTFSFTLPLSHMSDEASPAHL